MNSPVLPTGSIFEGFAIELEHGQARQELARELATLGPDWKLRPFGDRDTDFELAQSKEHLSAGEAWDRAYAIRSQTGVAYAEPLFTHSVSGNPGWLGPRHRAAPGNDDHLPESVHPEWSLDAIHAKEAWAKFFPDATRPPGFGVLIGHPDTGYQDHPELDGRILGAAGYDFLHDDTDAHDDLERPRSEPIPNPGHGTGTASVIVSPVGGRMDYPGRGWVTGVAPGAQVIPLRTAYSVMLMSSGKLSRAVEYAATHGAHVISISMGGLFSWRLRRAVRFAQSHGVIICAAAGNYAPFVGWPGAYDEVIACAASNARGGTWKWGCRGRAVDVTAPGESVWLAAVRREGDELVNDVGRGSGTSYATTTVAGIAALWLSRHGRDSLIARYGLENIPRVFSQVLRESCATFPGWKKGKFGAGLVDAFRTLDAPLPDIADSGTQAERDKDSHPEIDRGGLATFAHLFETQPSDEKLTRALAALLSTQENDLATALSETGQELAFDLGTDPDSYHSFAAILDRSGLPQDRAYNAVQFDARAAVGTGIDTLRQELSLRASAPLRLQLTEERTREWAAVTRSSPAPHP